jgi:adenylate cyclase
VPSVHRAPRRVLIFLCGVIPVLATTALVVFRPVFLTRLDDAVYDIVLRAAQPKAPGQSVAIVDVDDRSLSSIGQWPWRRDVVGRLIDRLRDAGASAIALDIIFAESDRDEQPGKSPDAALASALRDGRVVLGYGLTFDATLRERHRCVLHPVGVAMVQPSGDTTYEPLFRATNAVCNLPMLADAVAASGFLNAAPDPDGILRRVPLLAELDGRVYPSLALAAVAATTPIRDIALRIVNVNASALMLDNRTVPVDGQGNLLLRYRGKRRTFRYFSAADVLTEKLPAGALRGKIVFVGTTALGTREVVATPLDTLFAGVEVQATVADNLLEQDFIYRSTLGRTLDAVVLLGVGTAIAALVAEVGIAAGLVAAFATVVALWWGSVRLVSTSGFFISPLPPTLGVMGALAVMTLGRFTVERGRANVAGRERTAARGLMVQALLSLTEVRDAETGRHSRRTQQYARLLAERLATQPDFRAYLTPERIDLLSTLAPLHDIGKVGVPDRVLNKPGALTADELVEMRKHPTLGRDVILNAEARLGVRDDATLEMAKSIVYTHHERWDGAGYPQGLRGTAIPVEGRVMAVVDVYDAVSARALYQKKLAHDDTVAFIVSGSGTHFDPAVVDAFLGVAPLFKIIADEATAEAGR